MLVIGKLVFYAIALCLSMIALWFVRWDKIFTVENKIISILLYILCSIALAYLVGTFFITIATLR